MLCNSTIHEHGRIVTLVNGNRSWEALNVWNQILWSPPWVILMRWSSIVSRLSPAGTKALWWGTCHRKYLELRYDSWYHYLKSRQSLASLTCKETRWCMSKLTLIVTRKASCWHFWISKATRYKAPIESFNVDQVLFNKSWSNMDSVVSGYPSSYNRS